MSRQHRHSYESECEGKQAFARYTLAAEVARRSGAKPYRCGWCGQWHTGCGAGRRDGLSLRRFRIRRGWFGGMGRRVAS